MSARNNLALAGIVLMPAIVIAWWGLETFGGAREFGRQSLDRASASGEATVAATSMEELVASATRESLVMPATRTESLRSPTRCTIRVVRADGSGAREAQGLELALVAMDSSTRFESLRVAIGAEGVAGPIEVDARATALELTLGSSPRSRSIRELDRLTPGTDNDVVVELLPVPELLVRTRTSRSVLADCLVEVRAGATGTSDPLWSGSSDEHGELRIPWIWSESKLVVEASHPAFCATSQGAIPPDHEWAEDERPLELLLLPAGALEIAVMSEGNLPVVGCDVRLRWIGEAGGVVPWDHSEVRVALTTDDRGLAEHAPVPTGALFLVEAKASDESSGAAYLAGRPDQELQRIVVHLDEPATESLLVLDQLGEPLAGAIVGSDSDLVGSTKVDGRVQTIWPPRNGIDASLGWILAEGHAFYFEPLADLRQRRVVRLGAEGDFSGLVTREGAGVEAARLTLELGGEFGADAGRLLGQLSTRWSERGAPRTDANGHFDLPFVPLTDVGLIVRAPDEVPFRAGTYPVGRNDIRVELPGRVHRPRVRFLVSDSETLFPIAGAEVSVLFVDSDGNGSGVTRRTDDHGRLAMELATAGSYSLRVSAPGKISYFDSAHEFDPGDQEVLVRLQPPGEVRLVVTNAAGQPQPWLGVRAADAWGEPVTMVTKSEGGGENFGPFAITDAGGALHAQSLPPGELEFEIVDPADEQVVGKASVRVVQGECRDVSIVIDAK